MKFIGKALALLLLLLVATLAAVAGLLQTEWGVRQANQWVNAYSPMPVSFSDVSINWSHPSQITLNQFTLRSPQQPPFLRAQAVDLQPGLQQLVSPGHFSRITLRNGSLNVSQANRFTGLQADTLELSNMAVTDPALAIQSQVTHMTLSPWRPEPDKPAGQKTTWQGYLSRLTVDGQTASNIEAQGRISAHNLAVTSFQASVWGGSISGAFDRLATGQWRIHALQLDSLRLQTADTLPDLWQRIVTDNDIAIQQASIENARLEGSGWAVTDLNLTLNDVNIDRGVWQSEQGQIGLQGSEAVIDDNQLLNPQLSAHLTPQGITFTQATSQWQKGTLKAAGQWQRATNQLTLEQVEVNNLEYTLPANWKTFLTRPVPAWLDAVTVRTIKASRNLIIDIDPAFPWQITALTGEAQNIQLVKNNIWGIWQGEGDFSAQAATFNRTDILRPALGFHADANAVTFSKLNGLVDKGQLGATAIISQDPLRQTQITVRGEGIDPNALQNWGWPAIEMSGPVNLTLQGTALLAAGHPLRSDVNAVLTLTGNQETRQQIMKQGIVVP